MKTGFASALLMALAFAGCGEVRQHSDADAGNPSKDGGSSTGGSSATGGDTATSGDGGATTSSGGRTGSGGKTSSGGNVGSGGRTGSGGRATGGRGSGGIPTTMPDAGDVPLAQAAITFTSEPAPGKTCTTTNGQLSFPSRYNASVYSELNCDLSMGCKPDDYIVVDRDPGTSVSCTVSPAGENFNVLLSLDVDGSATNDASGQFGVAGLVSKTGGTVIINESNSVARGGGQQSDCVVKIASPGGVIATGKIWGSFDCPAFRDERNLGDTGCELKGEFLFENCTD